MSLLPDDINACAELVQKSDPDRFLAVMSIAPKQRAPLFVLYAFNLEVARAAWASQEPMVGQMRLQFWRDVVECATGDAAARAHDVARPLTQLIREKKLDTEALDQMITARWWDLNKDGFDSEDAFQQHLQATYGNLLWLTAQALGARVDTKEQLINLGAAYGLASWFQAVPELEKHNRQPLYDGRPEAVQRLAAMALNTLQSVAIPNVPWRFALRSHWQAKSLLKQARSDPGRVAQGALGLSEFQKKSSLFFKTFMGRF
mgnify:CR=1 FL=1